MTFQSSSDRVVRGPLQKPNVTGFTVIIVTHNSGADIRGCLNSILQYRFLHRLQLIVVDNASQDDTLDILHTFNYFATIIANPSNIGFGRACNLGAALAAFDILLFCNPDVVLRSDIFLAASRHFANDRIGALCPCIMNGHGDFVPSGFTFPHNSLSLIIAFARNILGRSDPERNYRWWHDNETLLNCDWVIGACMFVPRKHFHACGGFDEDYFLYFEDIDLCRRIRSAGLAIIADRSICISHKKYGSSRSHPPLEIRDIRRMSQLLYYRKHHGRTGELLARFLDRDGTLFRT